MKTYNIEMIIGISLLILALAYFSWAGMEGKIQKSWSYIIPLLALLGIGSYLYMDGSEKYHKSPDYIPSI